MSTATTQRSIGKSFYYSFQPGTTTIGVEMCFVHPGNGEAKQSVLTGFALDVGKEVIIWMLRYTLPINASDTLLIATNGARNINELAAMRMLFNVCHSAYLLESSTMD
jgi:hypothetical protein